ncbi:acyl-CoA thioesterase [Robertkochia aurantiaca]|uniref:acyl-CoA thioesterase n=1 Tax=Robertkochia aurantiaca TaxID=2873700 RepID=UPI001CC9CAF8|nr:thioesterase family protein [Robertkochia sp. 3YJGBD-33]
MEYHSALVEVAAQDLDELNHVNNVRYVEWVQDIAREHWQMKATAEMQNNFVWMVLTHHISYRKQAVMGDVIRLKTYVTQSEGVTSTRVVEMYRSSDDALLVRAKTEWCLINKNTGKPQRIPQEIKELF